MKQGWGKSLLRIVALAAALMLTACEEESPTPAYVPATGLAGVWYTQPGDDLAFLFYEDGRYELYTVEVGEEVGLKESGLYGCAADDNQATQGLTSRIVLGEGADDYQDLPISGTFYFLQDGTAETLSYDGRDYHRLRPEPDYDLLAGLAEMPVPWDAYLGVWENDTVQGQQLTITKETYQLVKYGEEDASAKSGGCIAAPDHLLLPQMEGEPLKLVRTEEGALHLEGYDGLFWPENG